MYFQVCLGMLHKGDFYSKKALKPLHIKDFKAFRLARCKGFDSQAHDAPLVAHGHNAPPERCSVPLVLRILSFLKRKRPICE